MTDDRDTGIVEDANYHEAVLEDGVVVVSEVAADELMASEAFRMVGGQIQRALANWAEDIRQPTRREKGLFSRNKYVTPGHVHGQMALAYDAADDDIVSGVLETSESIAFQKVTFESEDKDQENVWNQIAADLNLDGFMRSAFRELALVSQIYPVRWWGQKKYTVSGKGESRARRKTYNLSVPVGLGFLDPTRVVPVSGDIFGGTQLAWVATDEEFDAAKEPDLEDRLMSSLFVGQYKPGKSEIAKLDKEKVDPDRLVLLNPEFVFRHTLTKAPFDRWAALRMKSLFPLLDLKHQLREMDRAWLLGGINFVVLVTRGTDTRPSNVTEVNETAAMMRVQSKSPIIVTDHRIKIEIITPDIEHILNSEKWKVLDERILMKMWGTFTMPSDAGGAETSLTLGKVIARGLGSRRHMLKRSIEQDIVRPTQEHMLNEDEDFDAKVRMEYRPRHIELTFDTLLGGQLQELQDRGDLSRETILSELQFDQELEAQRREFEDEKYADTFAPVNVPFDSPEKTTPSGSGRKASSTKTTAPKKKD